MGATALSAVLGFAREVINAHYYGTRPEVDAYLNASTIPTVLFGILNGALVAALVPIFSEYMSQGRSDDVRRLGSTVINGLFIFMSGLAALGWFAAPLFVPVVAHGFPPKEQELVVEMVRWLMPGIIATSISGVFIALLNSNHRFFSSAMNWVAANTVTIVVVIVLHNQLGIFALVLGSVLGLFAQLVVQIPSILRDRLYRFELDFHHPGLAKIWPLLIPVVVGSGGTQVNLAFDRYFASTLASGSTAGIGYTTKLAYLPILIVAAAIGTVMFPLIAAQYASLDHIGLRRNVSLALRMVSFIVIPCAVGLIVLAYPIVQTLFERGAFGPQATTLCVSLLPFACLSLVTTSYTTVLSRACYACKEVRLAVIGSLTTVAINIVLSAILLPSLGARGLLLANGIAGTFFAAYLISVLWRLAGGFEWKPILYSVVRIALASMAMAAILLLIRALSVTMISHVWRIWYLACLLLVAGLVYTAASKVLRVEELQIVWRALTKKLSRSVVTPQS